MKKIKKLVLNKSLISNLNKEEMSMVKGGEWPTLGGWDTCNIACLTSFQPGVCPKESYTCPDTNILEGGDCYTQDYEVQTCEGC